MGLMKLKPGVEIRIRGTFLREGGMVLDIVCGGIVICAWHLWHLKDRSVCTENTQEEVLEGLDAKLREKDLLCY